uniref:amidohydrolase family protein n=1 Tax=Pararhizobium sp. IMCC3301 TaxID=3067904 RepID=UPI0027422E6B|nr:amidohydrolase family protein [Pararhizobium sp. IMCC3301]
MRLDAHQHFWNYTENADDFVWMTDDLGVLQQNFLPADLAPLLAAANMDGCIAVQAREVQAETDYLLDLAASNPVIKGVVGWVDLCAPDVEAHIEPYTDTPALKGFRMLIHDREDADFADSAEHARGVASLAKFGLSYDLLLRTIHLPSAIRLVDSLPDQPFVVDHIAKPKMDGSDWKAWQFGMQEIAKRPNVLCKLSGLVTEADWSAWQAASFTPYLDTVLEAFGPERLMIGSDWPVCTLAADYQTTLDIVSTWAGRLSATEQAAIMGGTCAKFYSVS